MHDCATCSELPSNISGQHALQLLISINSKDKLSIAAKHLTNKERDEKIQSGKQKYILTIKKTNIQPENKENLQYKT